MGAGRPVVENLLENRAQGLTHFLAVVAGPWCASEPCNGLRAAVDRPRALTGTVVSRVGDAGARSRTGNNLLSLNRCYIYGMMNVTGRRPFSELGDQQLLDQTRRLAANQRCIEVHILDHLDEIDRRGLALRRGFSSLFDYAVRELGFSDAAAQRRIQTMRLSRRHGWVRAMLQSGDLNLTSAAQLETAFAGAERAERQCRMGRQNVGQGRCHDQEQWARPHREAGDQDRCTGVGRRRQFSGEPVAASGHLAPAGAQPAGRLDVRAATGSAAPQSAPGHAPRAGQCSGDAAVNAPVVPVASHAVGQNPGAGHAGAPLPRPDLSGNATSGGPSQPPSNTGSSRTAKVWPVMVNASPFRAPLCAPVAAAPSSHEGPAPQLLPPTDLPAPVHAPVPVAAPVESLHAASRVPESSRDDPFAQLSPGRLSPGPVSAAPLLHPQRQRELIEQAAGMSTRQVAGLLAAAAPEVVPPRDTLRAVAPDRYTLKATIDQECEQGLRRLKDLLSHVDPRMSWGDLVARVVREAVARHDPRGGGSGQRRRRSADSAGASPRRTPNKTRAAGAAARPAQRAHESSGRAPKKTCAAAASAAPAQRGGGDTPANPKPTVRRGSQRPPHFWMAPAQVAFHRARPRLLRRRSLHSAFPLEADRAAQQPLQRPAPRRMAPMPVPPCRSRRSALRRRSLHSAFPLEADRAAQQPLQRPAPRRMAPVPTPTWRSRRPPLRRRSWHSACSLTADRPAPQPGQRGTRPANLSTAPTNPRHGATFPRLSGATSGNATEDAAVIAIRSPGAAAPLPICCRSTTCCRSPRGVVRSRPISSCRALLITACATATDRLRRRSPRCSASSALLPHRSAALADGLQVARRDTLRIAASRACIFVAASSGPGRSLSMRWYKRCRGLLSTDCCRCRQVCLTVLASTPYLQARGRCPWER